MDENRNTARFSHVSYVDFEKQSAFEWSPEDEEALNEQRRWKTLWQTYKNERCIILPDTSKWKQRWDFYIVIVLLFVAVTLPYRLAFYEKDDRTWKVVNGIVDSSFAVDIILTFFTAIPDYLTNGYITDKKKIALAYLKGWFIIDVISILPLDLIVANASSKIMGVLKFGRFARFAKIMRLVKVIRMTRLFRLCKDRNRMARSAEKFGNVNPIVGRLLIFLLIVACINHFLACLWVMASEIDEENNWLTKYYGRDFPKQEHFWRTYALSFYFVTTTVTTVGYGDVTPENMVEKVFCTVMLFVGVVTFSFASGSLSSVITNYDYSQIGFKKKLEQLQFIKKLYHVSDDLYFEIKSSLEFEYNRKVEGLGEFMSCLPLQLKYKLANEIHHDVLVEFDLFKQIPTDQERTAFLSWVGHRLVPRMRTMKDFLYQEMDLINGVFFIKEGIVAFVLVNYKNAIYWRAKQGSIVGFEDVVYPLWQHNVSKEDFEFKDIIAAKVQRKFTVITVSNVQTLEISSEDIEKIEREFPHIYSLMHDAGVVALGRLLKRRLVLEQVMEKCEIQTEKKQSKSESGLSQGLVRSDKSLHEVEQDTDDTKLKANLRKFSEIF